VDKYLLFGGLMIATVGAIKDLRGRTIPNWLSYSGILSGLTFRVAMAAWPALKSGFLGLLIGGGFFYLLFLAGGMGGGDGMGGTPFGAVQSPADLPQCREFETWLHAQRRHGPC